jgi:hypothetical protein
MLSSRRVRQEIRGEILGESRKMVAEAMDQVCALLRADEAGLGAALDERLRHLDALLRRWEAADEYRTSLARVGAGLQPH